MTFHILVLYIYVVLVETELQNVALNKPASQSSEEWTDQNTGMAVDGNPDSNYTHADHSCSHTDSNDPSITHAWWMVDLGKNYLIENITIQNRGDCCGFRLRNLSIMLASDHGNFVKRAWFQCPGTDGSYHEFEMHNFIGRYVRLETTSESSAILTLCKVEVWATDMPSDLQNVALNKPAVQSSEEPYQNAGMAVDGNADTNYTHTGHSCSHTISSDPSITHSWWMVDLGKYYRIELITIQNRGDCCGFRLRNLSIKLASNNGDFVERAWFQGPGTDGSYHEFEIRNFNGRYVRIETTSESSVILTLCEVEVWARDISKDATFTVSPGKKSNAGVLVELQTKSETACVFQCLRFPNCIAVNYWEVLYVDNCWQLDGVEPQVNEPGCKLIKLQ